MQFQPGRYFIGDVGYVLPRKDWEDILDEEGAHDVKGRTVWFHSTAEGDGTYKDQEGREYPVDTGTLGIAPVEACLKTRLTKIDRYGEVIEFTELFEVEFDLKGIFKFGDIRIDTRHRRDYMEDDDYDE